MCAVLILYIQLYERYLMHNILCWNWNGREIKNTWNRKEWESQWWIWSHCDSVDTSNSIQSLSLSIYLFCFLLLASPKWSRTCMCRYYIYALCFSLSSIWLDWKCDFCAFIYEIHSVLKKSLFQVVSMYWLYIRTLVDSLAGWVVLCEATR